MKSKLGIALMLCGAAALIASAVLLFHNRQEDVSAGEFAAEALPKLEAQIKENKEKPLVQTPTNEMTTVSVDGEGYIGVISLPTIDRQLPVLAEMDKAKLKKAPCLYRGSVKTDDCIIAAHNYRRHFGSLARMAVGDAVFFTDMEGVTTRYQVVDTQFLQETDVDRMENTDADLTLFTCTYSGRERTTVRCERVY